MKIIGGLMMAAGGLVLIAAPPSGSVTPPNPQDVLSRAFEQERSERVTMLRAMHAKYIAGEFADDTEQAEWHNAEGRRIIAEAYVPYTDAVAEAIYANRQNPDSKAVIQLADAIEQRTKVSND